MSLSWMRKLLGVAVVLGALAGAFPLFAQTGGVSGRAAGEDGNALVGYPIIIERQDVRGNYKTKTNKRGQYIYIGLPIGDYKVTLQEPRGRTLYFFNIRVGMGDPTQVDFDLAKLRVEEAQQRQRQIEENPELKRQVEERAKEETRYTSLKEFFDQGQALYMQERYPEALQMFEQALPLAKEDNLPVVLARLADTYSKVGEPDKAIEAYRKAIEANPAEAAYHNNLGNVYAHTGKIPEAAEEFKKAAEIDPTQASRYYFNYGVVMYNTGKMDEALEAFKKATEIDPDYADAYFLQAQALMGKVDYDEDGKVIPAEGQLEALQTYLKLDPNGANAATAQQLLQTLQGKIQTEYTKPKKKKKG